MIERAAPAFCPHCGYDLKVDSPVILNEFSMFGAGHPLCYNGRPLKLTAYEAEICWSLLKAYPDKVKYTTLLDRLDSDGERNTINVLISRLRKHFTEWNIPCPVKTLRGNGYIWDPSAGEDDELQSPLTPS